MSTYPSWSLFFRVRPDLDERARKVLEAVASDRPPEHDDLATLHPVVRYYLSDWHRLLAGEQGPFSGPPLRLSRSLSSNPELLMSIEFSQHDDEYANGGYVFWLWVLRLVARPDPATSREVIGCHGLYRNDDDTALVAVDAEGITDGGVQLSFDALDESWDQVESGSSWDDWSP